VELWFGKIERDLIARGVFTSVNDLARKIRRYIKAYSANAKPIQWKYSDPTRRIRSNELTATGHLVCLHAPQPASREYGKHTANRDKSYGCGFRHRWASRFKGAVKKALCRSRCAR
jgi:hypothetical protein